MKWFTINKIQLHRFRIRLVLIWLSLMHYSENMHLHVPVLLIFYTHTHTHARTHPHTHMACAVCWLITTYNNVLEINDLNILIIWQPHNFIQCSIFMCVPVSNIHIFLVIHAVTVYIAFSGLKLRLYNALTNQGLK